MGDEKMINSEETIYFRERIEQENLKNMRKKYE